MKWSVTLAFAAALLVGSQSTAGGDKHSAAKQFQVNLVVFQGDPLGSLEARTLKISDERRLVIRENRPFSYDVSGHVIEIPDKAEGEQFVQFGRKLEGKAGVVKDGKVRLDITLSNTTFGERTGDSIQLQAESTRTISAVRLGETVKLRWAKGSADRQTWIELSVKEVKP
jgi:hypothetical protein